MEVHTCTCIFSDRSIHVHCMRDSYVIMSVSYTHTHIFVNVLLASTMLSSLSAARQGQSSPVQNDGVKKREVRLMKNRYMIVYRVFMCTYSNVFAWQDISHYMYCKTSD